MDRNVILVLIFILLAILFSITVKFVKKHYSTKIVRLLEERKFDEFDQLIETFIIKILFMPFNIDYMKLNSAILRDNKKMILQAFEKFEKHRLNHKQKSLIYMMAFNYYVSVEDQKYAKKYLNLVIDLKDEQMVKEATRIYDIYIEKGDRYLEEILEETKNLPVEHRGVNEFLISIMYENKKDHKKAKEYRELSETHIAMLDELLKAKK